MELSAEDKLEIEIEFARYAGHQWPHVWYAQEHKKQTGWPKWRQERRKQELAKVTDEQRRVIRKSFHQVPENRHSALAQSLSRDLRLSQQVIKEVAK